MSITLKEIPLYASNTIKEIIGHPSFPWYYNSTTVDGAPTSQDKHQLVHNICKFNTSGSPHSDSIYTHLAPYIPEFYTHTLERCKINLNTPYKRKQVILPHIDHTTKGAVSYIYYVHDSDGPTRFYKSKWKTEKVYPKQGRLVRFPSNTLHSGNVPYKFENRTVVNFIFLPQ